MTPIWLSMVKLTVRIFKRIQVCACVCVCMYVFICMYVTIPTCVQPGSRHGENQQATLISPFLLLILLAQLDLLHAISLTVTPCYLHAICVFKCELPRRVWFQIRNEWPHLGHCCWFPCPVGGLGSSAANVLLPNAVQSFLSKSTNLYFLLIFFFTLVPSEHKMTLANVRRTKNKATFYCVGAVAVTWQRDFRPPLFDVLEVPPSLLPTPTPPSSSVRVWVSGLTVCSSSFSLFC